MKMKLRLLVHVRPLVAGGTRQQRTFAKGVVIQAVS
jgi:hypothetical protein